MDGFAVTKLNKLFDIEGVITVHYFEFGKNYLFFGESHDFWEFVYTDKGEIEILADETWSTLKNGNMVFHQPMQFHNIRANGAVAANAVVITFKCTSPAINSFNDMITSITEDEKALIAKIVSLSKKAFSNPLDDLYTKELNKTGNLAAEQLIQITLEELLLSIYMRLNKQSLQNNPKPQIKGSLSYKLIQYMSQNLNKVLYIRDIADMFAISESELKRTFKLETGSGIMTYFRGMKINQAKQYLRDDTLNITEISDALGYNSIHHFSRQFKSATGMSPKEYSKSIKLRLDGSVSEK